jgi:hypothetical protein
MSPMSAVEERSKRESTWPPPTSRGGDGESARDDSWHTRPVLLPITTDVLVEEAERLGDDGHRYSSRQLYYAACRAVERPAVSVTRGFIGLGAVLIVLGGAVLWVKTMPLSAILAVIGVALLLAAPLNARVERNRELRRALDSRTLVTSYPEFLAGPLAEALRARSEAFTALVSPSPSVGGGTDPPAAAHGDAASASDRVDGQSASGPLVVGDRSETAELLTANASRLPDGTEVAALAALITDDGGELAPGVRGRRLVAIHDADPAGCGLPATLRRAGATDIVDAGLRPPASDAGLQVIQGAPARMPAGIEADLSPVEVAWLRSGRRLELATLTPREAVALVCAASPQPSAGSPSRP